MTICKTLKSIAAVACVSGAVGYVGWFVWLAVNKPAPTIVVAIGAMAAVVVSFALGWVAYELAFGEEN